MEIALAELLRYVVTALIGLLVWLGREIWNDVDENRKRINNLEKAFKGFHNHLLQLDETHNSAPGCPYCDQDEDSEDDNHDYTHGWD